ncbi:hypothetical protein [Phytopseudomonas dryadis]|uniref:DNA repair protein n=1 Tax=Phytopseudomonas dryadis TaxID=2487520 RepID=A0A4Q9QWA5_9GAMM|nr:MULTISPECIES: hypothetical protein [Pseudomonas]TBU88470.1 hypothetical protein DNK44_18420 [Pseudomonas dryadis]TBV09323.1 hypothetical protein DNK34_01935 [Pseudomonas dryadis]TBV18711.1 hypothetical protein DNK41_06675 [Pseudomonas sp. FRB 230]
MSSLVITLSIVGGIAILILIAYLNQMAESNKLKKARLKADLSDRYRRLADLNEQFPGQLMTPELKLLLSRLQLHFVERLLAVDKHDDGHAAAAQELGKLIGQGEAIPVRNPPQPVASEAKAKDIRFQLESLHSQVTRAAQAGLIPQDEAKRWLQEIRHMLAQVYIELFSTQAQEAMRQKQPGHARLALERGVQFLQKQADAARYQSTLAQFQKQLARVNALLVNIEQQSSDDGSELTEGLKSLDDEDWKKKTLYD